MTNALSRRLELTSPSYVRCVSLAMTCSPFQKLGRVPTTNALCNWAVRGRRVLLTEDRDFGQLVYADRRATAGVILIRFPASARSGVGHAVVELGAKVVVV